MACFHPVKANLISYLGGRCVQLNPFGWEEGRTDCAPFDWTVKKDGRDQVVRAFKSECIWLPCGKCEGCLIERSRQWASRCIKESQNYKENCFLTLTYDNDHLPANNSLIKRDLQLFIKRLRKQISPARVRYFGCGEYGSLGLRPHYHLILFGYDFTDLIFHIENNRSFTESKMLKSLWKYGFVSVGKVTFESCAYVARYVMKKLHPKILGDRTPEFICMSTRPGIANLLFNQNGEEISENGFMFSAGRKVATPRYCDKVVAKKNPLKLVEIKEERKSKIKPYNPVELGRKIAFTHYLQSLKTDRKL